MTKILAIIITMLSVSAFAQENCSVIKCKGARCSAKSYVINGSGSEYEYSSYPSALDELKKLIESKKCKPVLKVVCHMSLCNGYDCNANDYVIKDHNGLILDWYLNSREEAKSALGQLQKNGICVKEMMFQ